MSRFAFVALTLFYAVSAGGQLEPVELTPAEEKAVAAAAAKALTSRNLWKGKVYLTNTEVIFDNSAKPPTRFAILTFYRYEGDLAILVNVQVDKAAVTKVETLAHMPASLAPDEIAEAEKIARAQPDIQKALARYKHLDKIEVDTILAQIIDPTVPGYQHRVARLFFRDAERNYLPNVPMVDVDLTTGEVRYDLIRGMHDKK